MRKSREETYHTIQKLIEIARRHFTEKGYENAALEEIVKEAELTRGALYHHFKNKKGLFLAVFETVQKEVAVRVEQEASQSEDLWEQLLNGCRAFLEAAAEAKNQRIMLIEGPAVLGWDTFRRMDEKYSMSALKEQLQLMQDEGMLRLVSIDALTHCLSGAMNEAALWMAEHPDHKSTLNEVMETLNQLLTGFSQ